MNIVSLLQNEPLIKKVTALGKRQSRKIYLVGGLLRDLLLGVEELLDFDFAVDKDSVSLAKIFSDQIGGSFVLLDEKHGCGRAVYSDKTIDFTDLRGNSIEEDLYKRDFTINSLALDLDSLQKSPEDFFSILIDPYKGYQDLQNKIIRAVSKESFSEDPVRTLRAFSFAANLNFEIDSGTIELIKDAKGLLKSTSFERIRDELFKIFGAILSAKHILMLDEMGILEEIFSQIKKMRPVEQGPYHHLDVWRHSLETLKELELLLVELEKDFPYYQQLEEYLAQSLTSERSRRQLLKLITLLHDVGKPESLRFENGKIKFYGHEELGANIIEEICDNLRLSVKEKHSLKNMTLHHLRPGYLAENFPITKRATFRFFRDAGEDALSVLLLSLADKRATRGPLVEEDKSQFQQKVILGLMEEYFKDTQEKRPPRLVTGDDLIKELKLSPSPIIGRILREIEEAQSDGQVTTRTEALELGERLKEEIYKDED